MKQKIGFSEAYMSVQYLLSCMEKAPKTITEQTVAAFLCLIQSNRFDKKKQAYFLYKAAAFALVDICLTHPLAGSIISSLQGLLLSTRDKRHRAVSEALGSLPLRINGPDIPETDRDDTLEITFETLLIHCNRPDIKTFHWHGRTLTLKTSRRQIACIKFAKTREDASQLSMEARWLTFLRDNPPCLHSEFKVPIPLCVNGKSLFKITCVPDLVLKNHCLSNEHPAIVFLAEKDYFHYPNVPGLFSDQTACVKEVFRRNAWLLGKLMSKGIIHTALIPLFHNRIQQVRRNDQGAYIWELRGRLDKWLESSQYPNFATSGLRDFEHLISIKDTKRMHHFIGEHILGFVLVAGSYFRNKAPEKVGFDEKGDPFDTRNLFDKSLFFELLKDIVTHYYQALTNIPLKNIHRLLDERLIDHLVEQMGIDHHMEEILRIQDQNNMSDTDFQEFLISRGYGRALLKDTRKGERNIILNTGPHLGGFNQIISVPQLMDFLFCLSSLCISDRYVMENGLKAS